MAPFRENYENRYRSIRISSMAIREATHSIYALMGCYDKRVTSIVFVEETMGKVFTSNSILDCGDNSDVDVTMVCIVFSVKEHLRRLISRNSFSNVSLVDLPISCI